MQRSRTLVAVCASLIVIVANVLVLEIAVALYHWHQTGTLIWTRAASASADIKSAAAPVADDPVKTKMTLSPYFGDNTIPGVRFRGLWTDEFYKERVTGLDYLPSYYDRISVNNHGFWGLHDYPYTPKSDEFIVGVFGGSVAFHFWLSTLDERSAVLKRFAEATGKRVVFLNFASGGRKQPQTMLQLAYFMSIGQRFDFVLNLDGFNEIYTSWLNVTNYKTNYSMPFAEFAIKIQNAFLDRAIAGDDPRAARLIDRRDRWAARASTTRSALVYYASNFVREYQATQLVALETQLGGERNGMRYPVQLVATETDNYDDLIPKVAELWANGSLAMHRMATPNGASYLHVLQPNQYFSRKTLTAQENEWTVRGATHVPLEKIVPLGYRAYLQRATAFVAENVAFIDATPIYDTMTDTVFIDWCCHVNEKGNLVLNAAIEPKMIEMLNRSKPGARQ